MVVLDKWGFVSQPNVTGRLVLIKDSVTCYKIHCLLKTFNCLDSPIELHNNGMQFETRQKKFPNYS